MDFAAHSHQKPTTAHTIVIRTNRPTYPLKTAAVADRLPRCDGAGQPKSGVNPYEKYFTRFAWSNPGFRPYNNTSVLRVAGIAMRDTFSDGAMNP
jgi:hypothetical protein